MAGVGSMLILTSAARNRDQSHETACYANLSALTRAWAAAAAGRITVAELLPLPMPTALRARFHPGEDRAALTPCADVAGRLLGRLDAVAPGARIALD